MQDLYDRKYWREPTPVLSIERGEMVCRHTLSRYSTSHVKPSPCRFATAV
jgi:hypothetical protein